MQEVKEEKEAEQQQTEEMLWETEDSRDEELSSDSQGVPLTDLSSCDALVVDYLEKLQQAGMVDEPRNSTARSTRHADKMP